MLIIECDSNRLASERLALGAQISRWGALALGEDSVALVRATTDSELLRGCAELAEAGRKFELVVLVGHSSIEGLRLTSERVASWTQAASWVAPFGCTRLALLACEAGALRPAAALFEGIRTLKVLYGSATTVAPVDAAIWSLLLVLVGSDVLPEAAIPLAMGVALAQGQVMWLQQTRRDVEELRAPEAVARVLFEAVLQHIQRRRRAV